VQNDRVRVRLSFCGARHGNQVQQKAHTREGLMMCFHDGSLHFPHEIH
jgi:hypothetical protein